MKICSIPVRNFTFLWIFSHEQKTSLFAFKIVRNYTNTNDKPKFFVAKWIWIRRVRRYIMNTDPQHWLFLSVIRSVWNTKSGQVEPVVCQFPYRCHWAPGPPPRAEGSADSISEQIQQICSKLIQINVEDDINSQKHITFSTVCKGWCSVETLSRAFYNRFICLKNYVPVPWHWYTVYPNWY